MDALTTSLLVAVAVFLSSLVGLSLHRVVPEGHLSQETRSVILLGTGTLSLLASLVLGLLVSTAKSSYDATETRIQNYAAELILLDETLRDYGDGALPPRRLLRSYTELFMQILWPKIGAAGELGESGSAGALMEHVRETIRALQPVDEGQKWLQNQALEENILLLRQRWLLIEGRWAERAAGVYWHPRVLGYAHIRELRVQRAAECNGRDRLSVLLAGNRERNLPDT